MCCPNDINLLTRGGVIHLPEKLSYIVSTMSAQVVVINRFVTTVSVQKYSNRVCAHFFTTDSQLQDASLDIQSLGFIKYFIVLVKM